MKMKVVVEYEIEVSEEHLLDAYGTEDPAQIRAKEMELLNAEDSDYLIASLSDSQAVNVLVLDDDPEPKPVLTVYAPTWQGYGRGDVSGILYDEQGEELARWTSSGIDWLKTDLVSQIDVEARYPDGYEIRVVDYLVENPGGPNEKRIGVKQQ